MSKTIKKLILLLMLLLVGVYVTSPYWLVQVIKAKAPDNWQIKQLDIAYPTFYGVALNDIDVVIVNQDLSEIELVVSNLKSDLDLNDFSATHVLVKTSKKQISDSSTEQQNLLAISDLQLNQYTSQLPHVNLSVDVLDLQIADNQYQFSEVTLSIDEEISLNLNIEANQYITKKLPVEMRLQANQFNTQLNVLSEKINLLDLDYQSQTENNELNLSMNTTGIEKILQNVNPQLIPLDKYQNLFTGNINVLLLQDKKSQQINSQIKLDGEVALNQKSVSLQVTAKSANQSYPFTIDFNVKSAIKSDFYLKDFIETEQNILFKNIELDFNNIINIDKDNIVFSKNKLKTLIDNVNLLEQQVELKNINLQTTVDKVQIVDFENNSSQFELNKIKLKTKIINTEMKYQAQNVTTKLSGEINLLGLVNSKISGLVKLDEVKQQLLVNANNINAEIKLEDLNQQLTQGNVDIKINDHDGQYQGVNYQHLNVNLAVKLKPKVITAKGELLINQLLMTPLAISINRENNNIKADLANNQIDRNFINQIIEQELKSHQLSKKYKVQMLAGQLSHQGFFEQKNTKKQISKLTSNNQVTLSKAKIALNENIFHQVNSFTNISSLEPLTSQTNLTAEKIELASGLKITQPSVTIELLDDSSINIEQLNFKVLAADVKADKLTLLNGELKPASISVNGLSLTELIFFTELDNIFAEGNIDINVPITSRDSKLVVKNATFKSKANGVIKYNSGASSKDKNIALTALENFQYKQLDGTIDYDSQGAYHIKLHLLGANPNLYNGYPLDFIINLSGELPGLFKSTFLTGNFEEAIINAMHSDPKPQK